jgi:hypothetical protein
MSCRYRQSISSDEHNINEFLKSLKLTPDTWHAISLSHPLICSGHLDSSGTDPVEIKAIFEEKKCSPLRGDNVFKVFKYKKPLKNSKNGFL